MRTKKTFVGRLVENLTQSRDQSRNDLPHLGHPRSSVANRVATNGDSFTLACMRPEITLAHTETDSSKISATMKTNTPATAASIRSLRINREAS